MVMENLGRRGEVTAGCFVPAIAAEEFVHYIIVVCVFLFSPTYTWGGMLRCAKTLNGRLSSGDDGRPSMMMLDEGNAAPWRGRE
jgi:hypothetical protein